MNEQNTWMEGFQKAKFYLAIDKGRESDLALKYLQEQAFRPNVVEATQEMVERERENFVVSPAFADSFKEPLIPSLFLTEHPEHQRRSIGYFSFSGVKSFLREMIVYRINAVKPYEKSSRSLLDENPSKSREVLEKHDFLAFHHGGESWRIGSIDALVKQQDKKGVIIHKPTATVLFPDDIEILRSNRAVHVQDSRSAYHVTYEAYFNDSGTVCGVYASLMD